MSEKISLDSSDIKTLFFMRSLYSSQVPQLAHW